MLLKRYKLKKYSLSEKITFCVSSSTLFAGCNTVEKQDIKLDYLESLVLNILVTNSYRIVSHEEFLSNWRSPEATTNSLSRVISLLRSKLKKVGLTEKVIINTPKKGYSFVGSVELLIDRKSLPSHKKIIPTNKKLFAIFIVVLLLAVLSFFTNFEYNEPTNKEIKNISSIELLNNTDIKLELTSNSKNNLIAYSTRSYDSRYWEISIFDRFLDENIIIQDTNYNVRKPAWLSENQLIFRVYNEKSCMIKSANIDFLSRTYTSNNVFSCNPESYSSSIAKFNASQILFTEAELGSKASKLYLGNIETGFRESIDIDDEGGLGIYNVITSPKSELIVLLSSSDGIQDKIRLVDPNNAWEVVWAEKLTMTNISVAWDGSLLSFRNNNGGISIVSFEEHNEISRTELPFIVPVHNVSSTNNGLLFTSGEFVTQDIAYTELKSTKSMVITENSNAKNKLADFYAKNLIIYISNRTGINQIWLYNLNSQTSKQISSFRKNYNIFNIATNFNYSKIALEFDNNITIFDLSPDYVLSKNPMKIEGINPEFFEDKLVFTKFDGSKYSLYTFSLTNSHFNNLKTNGGYIAKSNGEDLYYSKQYAPGIWLYQDEEKDKHILELPSSAYQWYIDLESIYYRNDIGDNFKFNITNGLITPFSSDSCKVPINVNNNKCLSIKKGPSVNKIILLEW